MFVIFSDDIKEPHYAQPSSLPCSSKNNCPPINCVALLEGDSIEQQRAKQYMLFNPRRMPTDPSVIQDTKDCKQFVNKEGYPEYPGSEEEAGFPIAFSILFHKCLFYSSCNT